MSGLTRAKTLQAKKAHLVTIGEVGIDNTLAGLAAAAKAHIKPLGDQHGEPVRKRWKTVEKALREVRAAYTADVAREHKKKAPRVHRCG